MAGDPQESPLDESPLIRISEQDLQMGIEAVLFSTGEPVPIRQLAELFEVSVHDVRQAVEELRLDYVNTHRAFRLEDISGGVQILTLSRYEPWIRRYLSKARDSRLSPAAFETLAVIAYKQPITKADLEAIRGVQCGPILKTLMDRSLIKVVGREDTLGKPLLYGTTKRFLESFGISSITGLPQPELDVPGSGGGPGETGGAVETAGTEEAGETVETVETGETPESGESGESGEPEESAGAAEYAGSHSPDPGGSDEPPPGEILPREST